jgi:hypothetical protein
MPPVTKATNIARNTCRTIRDRRMSIGDDWRPYLRIYIADRSAAATAGVALTRRCLRSNEGTALGAVLRQLLSEIEEDPTTLAAIWTDLNLKDDPLKRAVALVGELLARVKFNQSPRRVLAAEPADRDRGDLDQHRRERSLWLALQQHAPTAALERFDLSELVGRGENQRSSLRPHHLDAAAAAFR